MMILRKYEGYNSYYISIDAQVAHALASRGVKRVLVRFPDGTELHRALAKWHAAEGSIVSIDKATVKRLRLLEGKPVDATIDEDTSELQFSVPEELIEVLAQDDAAYGIWDTLTDGNKRSLMSYINSVKNTDKRIERSFFIAENLKAGITRGQDMLKKKE